MIILQYTEYVYLTALGESFEAALENDTVYTVRPEWLFHSAALGELQPEQKYLVQESSCEQLTG